MFTRLLLVRTILKTEEVFQSWTVNQTLGIQLHFTNRCSSKWLHEDNGNKTSIIAIEQIVRMKVLHPDALLDSTYFQFKVQKYLIIWWAQACQWVQRTSRHILISTVTNVYVRITTLKRATCGASKYNIFDITWHIATTILQMTIHQCFLFALKTQRFPCACNATPDRVPCCPSTHVNVQYIHIVGYNDS